jgi:squalene-hopene/tetraprenyl-beta-curcumene cyclase
MIQSNIATLCVFGAATWAASTPHTAIAQQPDPNLSLKLEIQRAIGLGIKWLNTQQADDGSFGDPEQPALTALPVSAIMADPRRVDKSIPSQAKKGYAYLVDSAKDDGGLYIKGLACYNTSLSMMALLQEESGQYRDVILKARRFLINQQSDFDFKGESDNPYDGGIGYGGTYAHSDLSNTHFVLESLYYSKSILAETGADTSKMPKLDWDAAIKFVERCQNLKATNDQEWASDDPANKGGFVYFPGNSKAGKAKVGETGRTALRSYGSMSYAGLLSLIYADLKPEDTRIQAVLRWLQENYTLEENPGLGLQGLFYYYHSMAKALHLVKVDTLELKDGTKINWREDLAKKMFNLQQTNGSWTNENGRWWEKDPVLATSYALLTLEYIYVDLDEER